MSYPPSLIEQARREIISAPFGHKGVVARRWAGLMGTTITSLYRMVGLDGRAREGVSVRPELQDWTLVVFTIKKRPPDEAGEISTDQAVKIAVAGRESGACLIPNERIAAAIGQCECGIFADCHVAFRVVVGARDHTEERVRSDTDVVV